MKHILATILLALLTFGAAAQTVPAGYSGQSEVPGTKLKSTGQTLVWAGAATAATSLIFWRVEEYKFKQHYNPETPTMNLAPMWALIGGGIGAGLALVGAPMIAIGNNRIEKNGFGRVEYLPSNHRGFALVTEVGGGIPNYAQIRVTPGYEINRNLFVGAGLGYSFGLFHYDLSSVPVYAQARVSFGKHKVAPYVAAEAGYELGVKCPYVGMNLGARAHTAGDHSWLFGITLEYGEEIEQAGLRIGFQF